MPTSASCSPLAAATAVSRSRPRTGAWRRSSSRATTAATSGRSCRSAAADELPPAGVDPDVPESREEDEIARSQRLPRDAAPAPVLAGGEVRQVDPDLGVDVLDEPGAGEAGPRRGAAPAIGDAGEVIRDLDGTQAGADALHACPLTAAPHRRADPWRRLPARRARAREHERDEDDDEPFRVAWAARRVIREFLQTAQFTGA